MASSVPGLRSLPDSRYDLSTYMGRVKHCAVISDPTMLLTTNKDLSWARDIISKYKNGTGPMTEDTWRAKRILDASIHPDTGQKILLPFRMSCYVLSNLVVTVGMLTPNQGTFGTIFWHVANQSLNVAVNTANSNKSHPLSTQQLLTSFSLAVSASCSVAVGLNALVPRLKSLSPHTRLVLGRLVPFAAVAVAGMLNVFVMRSHEIVKGITVYDTTTNEPVGNSKKAAFKAVFQTGLSRVINATPIMVIPPLILVRLQKGFLRGKSKTAEMLVNLGLITVTSFAVLPFALGLFPQRSFARIEDLEPELRDKKNKEGQTVTQVWYNRGM